MKKGEVKRLQAVRSRRKKVRRVEIEAPVVLSFKAPVEVEDVVVEKRGTSTYVKVKDFLHLIFG